MKKTLAIILALSLLCIMAVGTTMTYFTDTDGTTNTMTVGKVTIDQIEQKRGATEGTYVNLIADANGVTSLGKLYPYTGEDAVNGWFSADDNAVDKIVSVENTGSEAAYIRTVFAFEMMNVDGEWKNPLDNSDGKAKVHLNVNPNQTIDFDNADVVIYRHEINGNDVYNSMKDGAKAAFVIGVSTYENVLGGTSVSENSLRQIYLDSSVGNNFSDAIGGQYEVLVLSQAVQAKGFETVNAQTALNTAFGAVTAEKAAEWFN